MSGFPTHGTVCRNVRAPWGPSASPRAQIKRKLSCDTSGTDTICLLRRCRVSLEMRLYFLLQIRCSGPVCNCSKPELISSRSCWAPTSDWAPSLSDCEKCQKQNSPSVPVPTLAPHWTLQDLNSGFSPVPQLSMPPWKISPATPTSKDHRKEISTAKESSSPRAAQVDGTWGTIEASFFGLQLPATAGTCLWDVPSGAQLLLSAGPLHPMPPARWQTWARESSVLGLAWHCCGVTWQSWLWIWMDKDTKVNAKHRQNPW